MTLSLDQLKAAADRAYAAFQEANGQYVRAIRAEIARLEELPTLDAPPPQSRKPRAAVNKRGIKRGPIAKGKKSKPHGIPGNPGKLSDGSPSGARGDKTCKKCGREGLLGQRGPGGYLAFHRAPTCELPCEGANLKNLTSEDLADGVHKGPSCYGCQKAKSA